MIEYIAFIMFIAMYSVQILIAIVTIIEFVHITYVTMIATNLKCTDSMIVTITIIICTQYISMNIINDNPFIDTQFTHYIQTTTHTDPHS